MAINKNFIYGGIGVLTLGALAYIGSGYAKSDSRPIGITSSGNYQMKVGDKEPVLRTLVVTSSDGLETVMACERRNDDCITFEAFGNQLKNRAKLGEMQTLNRLEEQRLRRESGL